MLKIKIKIESAKLLPYCGISNIYYVTVCLIYISTSTGGIIACVVVFDTRTST